MTTKLFISHSTRNEQNLCLLNRIYDELQGQGFEVLVDRKTLQPGDPWHQCINEWMYECHAAVILLSNAALDSPWVKSEAVVLSNRKRNEKDHFRLIPVALETVKAHSLKGDPYFGGVARLDDWQLLCDCKDDEDVVCKLKASLEGLRPTDSPFDGLVDRVRQILDGIKDEALEQTLASMACARSTRQRFPADALTRALFRKPAEALCNLRILVEALCHLLVQEKAWQLLRILEGIWVHAEAAANLVKARDDKRPAAINALEIERFTGRCYARRAWPFPTNIRTVPVGPARGFSQIEAALLGKLGRSTRPECARKRVREIKDPILLMFPPPLRTETDIGPEPPMATDADIGPDTLPDQSLLDDIEKEFPNVTVLLATGRKLPEHLPGVVSLLPPLETGEEDRQCRSYDDFLDFIENQMGRPEP